MIIIKKKTKLILFLRIGETAMTNLWTLKTESGNGNIPEKF